MHVDGADAVHSDGRSHSGAFVTMGTGSIMNVLKKISLVTNRSTKTEVVPTGERFPKCTWFRYFHIAQGEDERKEDMMLQDN